MNQFPLVSIVTIVYNGEKFLQQTIDSVHKQTYDNIEYILVDGGSTDGTLDIIKENEKKISNWISEPDEGVYDAMNKGIKMSTGEIVGIINSDDWYDKHTVEIVVEEFIKHRHKTIFHGDRYDVYNNGEKKLIRFNKSNFRFKYFCMTYSHPSMFISKSVYQQNLYNVNLKVYSDYQLVLKEFLRNPEKLHYIPKPLAYFRLGGVSSNGSLFAELKESFLARRNAKMSIFETTFSYVLVLILRPLINLGKSIKK